MSNELEPNAAIRLNRYIQRIESLEEEKKSIAEDIKEIYGEASATGFDAKIMRQIIKIRTIDPNDKALQDSLIEVYLNAIEKAKSIDENIS